MPYCPHYYLPLVRKLLFDPPKFIWMPRRPRSGWLIAIIIVVDCAVSYLFLEGCFLGVVVVGFSVLRRLRRKCVIGFQSLGHSNLLFSPVPRCLGPVNSTQTLTVTLFDFCLSLLLGIRLRPCVVVVSSVKSSRF